MEGDIHIFRDAKVTINTYAPHISKGLASISIINSNGSVYCTGADIKMNGKGIPESVVPYHSAVAMFNAFTVKGNALCIDNSRVSIDLSAAHWPEKYANNFYGVNCGDYTGMTVTGKSSIDINIDVPEVFNAFGISVGTNMIVDPGCSIKINTNSMGKSTGITAFGKLTIEDASIDVTCASAAEDSSVRELTTGIFCDLADINITNSSDHIYAKVSDGAAFVVGMTDVSADPIGYTEGYKPVYTKLSNKAVVSLPAGGALSGYGYKLEMHTIKSVYDTKDTSAPVKEVYIGENPAPAPAAKKANTMTAKAKSKSVTVKYTKLRKKAQTIKRSKAITVKNPQGTVTYKLSSVTKKKFKKYFKVASKTGKITVKKGLKKGTYKLKIAVTAAGTDEYKALSKKVTVTVKVK